MIGDPEAIHHPGTRSEPGESLAVGPHTLSEVPSDMVELTGAMVVHGGGIIWKDHWIDGNAIHYYARDWASQSWRPGYPSHPPDTIDIYPDRLMVRKHVEGTALFCDSGWGSINFGHFVHDFLPYGLLYRRLRDVIPTVAPLAHAMRCPSQVRVMESVFGVPQTSFIDIDGTTSVERLFVARRQSLLDGVAWTTSFAGLRAAREFALAGFGLDSVKHISAVEERVKVLLHREQDEAALRAQGLLNGRGFANVPELACALLGAGFVALEPGRVPIATVARLLSQAETVVGIHGANMGNILFCPPGTRVLELRPAGGAWRDHEAIGAVLGHEFVGINQPAARDGEKPRIDIEELLQVT